MEKQIVLEQIFMTRLINLLTHISKNREIIKTEKYFIASIITLKVDSKKHIEWTLENQSISHEILY